MGRGCLTLREDKHLTVRSKLVYHALEFNPATFEALCVPGSREGWVFGGLIATWEADRAAGRMNCSAKS